LSGESPKTNMERLILKTDTLTVEVLPALGGKISSMRRDGIELLQQPLRPYAPRNLTMGFEQSDASGIDECLPSVAACEIKISGGTISIPDHGEFWRLPCTVEQSPPTTARLTATGSVLPLRFERTLQVEGDALRIDYRLENIGAVEVGYAWSAHPLFAVDAGDRIVLPLSVQQVHVEGSGRKRLGPAASVHSWPVTELPDGSAERLDLIGPAKSPWLGLWLCYGGWPEGQSERQYCVALEPCTAPMDSLAIATEKGLANMLAPGQASQWWMRIEANLVS
jgi:hypothetical protein